MPFWDRFRRTATRVEKANPFNGIAAVGLLSGLNGVHQNSRIQRVMQIRETAKLLGIPPAKLEEEMLAGGDINVNTGRSNVGPWLFATVLMLALLLGVLGWAWRWYPSPIAKPTPNQGQTYTEWLEIR